MIKPIQPGSDEVLNKMPALINGEINFSFIPQRFNHLGVCHAN